MLIQQGMMHLESMVSTSEPGLAGSINRLVLRLILKTSNEYSVLNLNAQRENEQSSGTAETKIKSPMQFFNMLRCNKPIYGSQTMMLNEQCR